MMLYPFLQIKNARASHLSQELMFSNSIIEYFVQEIVEVKSISI